MPSYELTPRHPPPGCAVVDLLRTGRVEVLGRMPWGSNATLLAGVHPPGSEPAPDFGGGDDGDGNGNGAAEQPEALMHAVYKPRRGERPLWDFPNGLDRREVAAYELSEALGWGIVPETVLRRDLPLGAGSLQRFVPFATEEHYFTLYEDIVHHDALRTICCFDLLANQTDRKSGHCLLGDDGRIWAIDNALGFHCESKLRTVIWEFGGEPIPEPLRADVRRLVDDGLPATLDPLLDDDEQEALLRRARAVADVGVFPIDGTGRRYPWPLV
jgi:uncharacterized repeat protein (TIGR03843 family)